MTSDSQQKMADELLLVLQMMRQDIEESQAMDEIRTHRMARLDERVDRLEELARQLKQTEDAERTAQLMRAVHEEIG